MDVPVAPQCAAASWVDAQLFMVTARVLAPPFPQLLEGVTCMFPLVDPKFTATEVVPCPEAMVEPPGADQV